MKQIKIQPIDTYDYVVVEDYSTRLLGVSFTIPKGFITDGNSTLICRFNPLYVTAAIIHDYLYAYGITTRVLSDKIYLEAMRLSGVPFALRYTFYTGVRIFGGIVWKNYRNE